MWREKVIEFATVVDGVGLIWCKRAQKAHLQSVSHQLARSASAAVTGSTNVTRS